MQVIDLGLSDPETVAALDHASQIVDEVVDGLHNAVMATSIGEGSELQRLDAVLPDGPIRLSQTIMAATDGARGALDQIVHILRNGVPTAPVVLQALLRTALVGTAHLGYVLLPSDPGIRQAHARLLALQDVSSGLRALKAYSLFTPLDSMRPPEQMMAEVNQQHEALLAAGKKLGDGAVVDGMIEALADALARTETGLETSAREQMRDHATWLWNTYSGAAHTLSWPRLLPGSTGDLRVPGDFVADLFLVASAAHVALHALIQYLQPNSANSADLDFSNSSPWIVP